MMEKPKITEIKETYTVKRKIRNGELAPDGSQFEEKTFNRFKEVITVEGWPRFGHYLLDRIFFYIFDALFQVALGVMSALFGFSDIWDLPSSSLMLTLISYLVFYPGYYVLFEATMQSTPGKLILGRVVIDEYGEKPAFSQILGRSYARVVPFEAFSCLSTLGWHDTWSKTMVIRKKDLEDLKMAMKAQEFGSALV